MNFMPNHSNADERYTRTCISSYRRYCPQFMNTSAWKFSAVKVWLGNFCFPSLAQLIREDVFTWQILLRASKCHLSLQNLPAQKPKQNKKPSRKNVRQNNWGHRISQTITDVQNSRQFDFRVILSQWWFLNLAAHYASRRFGSSVWFREIFSSIQMSDIWCVASNDVTLL